MLSLRRVSVWRMPPPLLGVPKRLSANRACSAAAGLGGRCRGGGLAAGAVWAAAPLWYHGGISSINNGHKVSKCSGYIPARPSVAAPRWAAPFTRALCGRVGVGARGYCGFASLLFGGLCGLVGFGVCRCCCGLARLRFCGCVGGLFGGVGLLGVVIAAPFVDEVLHDFLGGGGERGA